MNYIQQAYKGKNELWRYIVSILVIFTGWQIIGMIPLMAVVMDKTNDMGELLAASEDGFTSLGINSNLYLFVMILSFFFGLVALLFSIKKIHLRSVKTLFTSRNIIDWSRIT